MLKLIGLCVLSSVLLSCTTYVSTRDCEITCRREGAKLEGTSGSMCNCKLINEKPKGSIKI